MIKLASRTLKQCLLPQTTAGTAGTRPHRREPKLDSSGDSDAENPPRSVRLSTCPVALRAIACEPAGPHVVGFIDLGLYSLHSSENHIPFGETISLLGKPDPDHISASTARKIDSSSALESYGSLLCNAPSLATIGEVLATLQHETSARKSGFSKVKKSQK